MSRYFIGTGVEAQTISVKHIDRALFWCSSCDCDWAVIEIDYAAHCHGVDGCGADESHKIFLCQDCVDRLKKQINLL